MTTDAEIRSWAKEAGHDVPARGKVPEALRDAFAEAHPAPDNPGLSVDDPAGEHGYAEPEPMPTRPQTADEVAPTPPPPSRFPALRRGGRPREKGTHKRVSIEGLAEGVWGLLGNFAMGQGLVPTGRALQLQAPVAGMILEDALKGTIVDRVAQPIARSTEAAKEVGALLGVPVLVTILTVKPQAAPQIVPQLKRMMREWAIVAGPRMKARERREKKAMEQLGVDVEGLDALVDEWINALFAHPDEAAEGA
jgi:hypothetical protein